MHPDQLYWLPFLFWAALISTAVLLADLAFFVHQRRYFFAGWVVVLLSCIGLLAYHISDTYTGVGINEATWYHLRNGMTGLTWGQVVPVVNLVVMSLGGLGVVFYLTLRAYRARPAGTTKMAPRALVYAVAVLANPAFVQCAVIVSTLLHRDQFRAELNAELITAPATLPRNAQPKSVVYIYGESLEAAFLDEHAFPGLAPHLQALKKQSFSIEGSHQAPFTGWTIAGIIASQCAFPALGNQDHRTDTPTRNVRCLGDILHDEGYELAYLNGASLKFTGKDQFFKAHHFDTVLGQEELMARLGPLPHSQWGLYDDALFGEAEKQFDRLASSQHPFFLSLLTVDTHPPSGHQTPACNHLKRYRPANEMLQAVHCSDFLIDRFIQHIRARGRNDVIVVVSSDHLQSASGSAALPFLRAFGENRHNLWVASGPSITPRVITRESTTLDVAPTLLSLMGFDVPALHWGRNLASPGPTLPEKFGRYGFFDRLTAAFAMGDDGHWRQDIPNPPKRPLPVSVNKLP